MSGVADLGVDRRRARVVLALLAEPSDPITGRLLCRMGAVETLGLLDTDADVPRLDSVCALVRRNHLTSRHRARRKGWSSGCLWLSRAESPR